MTTYEWLLDQKWIPSIEGRDVVWASKSEKRRQLENKAWTITGFKVSGTCSWVDFMDPIDRIKPGPDDEMPDVIAEVTMCRGAKRRASIWYDRTLANALYTAWDEKLQQKYDRERKTT